MQFIGQASILMDRCFLFSYVTEGVKQQMVFRAENRDNKLTVYLSGELDHHGAGKLRDEVDMVIERAKPKELVLDFADINFMDSSGIGFVMGRYRLMVSMGGTVKVTGLSDRMERVMKLAGLDRLHILPEHKKGVTKR